MPRPRLLACPSCARHVRTSESGCPFCGDDLPAGFGAGPARVPPPARLSRGATYAFGAGTITLAVACSSSVSGTSDGGDSASSDSASTIDEGQPDNVLADGGPCSFVDGAGCGDGTSGMGDSAGTVDSSGTDSARVSDGSSSSDGTLSDSKGAPDVVMIADGGPGSDGYSYPYYDAFTAAYGNPCYFDPAECGYYTYYYDGASQDVVGSDAGAEAGASDSGPGETGASDSGPGETGAVDANVGDASAKDAEAGTGPLDGGARSADAAGQ